VCCRVLQGAAVCCSVSRCVVGCCSAEHSEELARPLLGEHGTTVSRVRAHVLLQSVNAVCCVQSEDTAQQFREFVRMHCCSVLLQCVVAVCYSQKTRHHGFASPHARTVAVLLQCVVAECCRSVLQSEDTAPQFCEFVCMHWMSEVELLKS